MTIIRLMRACLIIYQCIRMYMDLPTTPYNCGHHGLGYQIICLDKEFVRSQLNMKPFMPFSIAHFSIYLKLYVASKLRRFMNSLEDPNSRRNVRKLRLNCLIATIKTINVVLILLAILKIPSQFGCLKRQILHLFQFVCIC